MKTINLSWVETIQRDVTVNVPDDFDLAKFDLSDRVAELDTEGYFAVDRDQFDNTEVVFNADATVLDLVGCENDDEDDIEGGN